MPNISLTSINSALEKKMDGTDSSSNLTDVLRLATSADDFTSTVFYIDSSYLPTDSAFIGTLARDSDGTVYAYDGSSWTRPNKDGSITLPYSFQGTVSGYMSGGNASPYTNTIDKWPFATDGNATDVGDLTLARDRGAGQSSSVSGYTSGGYGPSSNNNRIDKFSFTADGNATDVGDLTGTLRENAGQSSENHGYTTGGHDGSPNPAQINDIQKFSFSSDENATDVGDLLSDMFYLCGQSSNVSGYVSGGIPNLGTIDIQKFPFSTDANSTDTGDLSQSRYGGMGQQV